MTDKTLVRIILNHVTYVMRALRPVSASVALTCATERCAWAFSGMSAAYAACMNAGALSLASETRTVSVPVDVCRGEPGERR